MRLGKTDLLASRTGFGAMKLDKSGDQDNVALLIRKAYDGGVNFFDTARWSAESEELLGHAIHPVRQNVALATKTRAETGAELIAAVDESLVALHTDWIELYQLEVDLLVPEDKGSDGIYQAFLSLKAEGKIKHFGIVTEDVTIARRAVKSGLYETVQVPFNVLSGNESVELVQLCNVKDVGFIAMQPLCGSVLSNIPVAFGYVRQFENVVPVWGARTQEELAQILHFSRHPPVMDEQLQAEVEMLRAFFN